MIERAWTFLQARFTRADAARLVSSLILATMLWGYVSLITDPEETQTFAGLQIAPLDGLDDNLILTSELPEVSVRLTGPESVLEDISPDEIKLSVDTDEIDGPTEGQDLRIQIDTPDGVRRSEANPRFVIVAVAERATPREIPLTTRIVDPPESPAIHVDQLEPAVSMVTVTGPAPAVNRVAQVILPVEIGSHTQTFEEAFIPVAVDADGAPIPEAVIQPQRIQTTVPIMQRGHNVAVLVDITGQPAPGYQEIDRRTIPQSVLVDGPDELTNSIVYVYTEPVDISNATQDVSTAVAIDQSRLPDGVTVLSPSNGQVQVIVQISMLGTPQTLPSQDVQVNGLAPGYTASLEPSEVGVVVEASTEQIEQLQPGDIAVSVDATGREAGTYQLRPAVSVPPEMSWIRTDPEFVSVTIVESDAFNGNAVPGLGEGDAEPVSPAASPSPVASPDA
jgi:YbbR domain-containing protein